jgi:ElaB/YqjD/DUF883 family membrane-anchored ribosome-binding protein
MTEYEPHAVASDNASMVTQVQEKVQETAQQASSTAAHAISTQLETRAGQAGSELRAVATALRRSGNSLHADGNEPAAKVVDSLVEKIESLAGYLAQADGNRMLHDVERFGRKRPWSLIGAGAALGFAGSRFLKASSRTRFETTQRSGTPYGAVGSLPPAPPSPSVPTSSPTRSGDRQPVGSGPSTTR